MLLGCREDWQSAIQVYRLSLYWMLARGTNAAIVVSVFGLKCSIRSTEKRSSQKLQNQKPSKRLWPYYCANFLKVILCQKLSHVPQSVRAMKAGAIEFLTKPFRDEELLNAINQAIERGAELRNETSFSEIVGKSTALRQVLWRSSWRPLVMQTS